MDDDHRIDLADAIEAIRDQLMAAAARGADSEISFEVGDIQLEFTVQLTQERTGKGGVKAWVLTAGYESARTQAQTQRVSVTLSPRQRDSDERVKVRNPNEADLRNFGPAS